MKKLAGILCGVLLMLSANLTGIAQAADTDEGWARRRHHVSCRCQTCRHPSRRPVQAPEPGVLILVGSGLLGVGLLSRRKR